MAAFKYEVGDTVIIVRQIYDAFPKGRVFVVQSREWGRNSGMERLLLEGDNQERFIYADEVAPARGPW